MHFGCHEAYNFSGATPRFLCRCVVSEFPADEGVPATGVRVDWLSRATGFDLAMIFAILTYPRTSVFAYRRSRKWLVPRPKRLIPRFVRFMGPEVSSNPLHGTGVEVFQVLSIIPLVNNSSKISFDAKKPANKPVI